jgi:hypothetical protein
VQPRERAGEIADGVTDHAHAEALVGVVVLVGVDDDAADLRREAFVDVVDQALAAEILQALVDAAHAPALAAGENESGDPVVDALGVHATAAYATAVGLTGFTKRCLPVNSR